MRPSSIRLTLSDQRSEPATRQSVDTGGYWTMLAGGVGLDEGWIGPQSRNVVNHRN
jgi:hypothetical protein